MHQTFQRQPAPVDQAAHHALQKAADVARLQVGVRNVAHQPVEQVAHTPAIQHERGLATAQFFQKADFDLALRGDIHHAGLPGAVRGQRGGVTKPVTEQVQSTALLLVLAYSSAIQVAVASASVFRAVVVAPVDQSVEFAGRLLDATLLSALYARLGVQS